MVKICPTCGGNQIGCPTCNAPPKHAIAMATTLVEPRIPFGIRLKSLLYGSPVWEVQAVDLSSWNGTMNFSITKTKAQAVILRFGYGNGWKDPKLDEYYSQARAQDMPVGGYWFCRPWEDPIQHANSFAELIATHPIQLDEHGDWEGTTNGKTPTQVYNWILAFEQQLQIKTSKLVVPYSSKNYWDNSVARSSHWIGRRVWPANWTTRDAPVVPYDWTFKQGDWWQWSADGNGKAREYGMVANGDLDMDLDRWNGTVAQFNAQYGTHITPIGTPPQPPPGTVPEVVLIGSADINIRSSPNPSDATNVMGVATHGLKWYPEAIEKDQYGKEWYKCGKKVYIKKELTRLP